MGFGGRGAVCLDRGMDGRRGVAFAGNMRGFIELEQVRELGNNWILCVFWY